MSRANALRNAGARALLVSLWDFAVYVALAVLLGAVRMLPYNARVGVTGWAARHLVAPLADIRKRVYSNLEYILSDVTEKEKERIYRDCVDNFGRLIIEILSRDEFRQRVGNFEIEGPGLAAIERARTEGRSVIVVSGHFGNYDTGRVALISRGHRVGAIYRRFNNRYFNAYYEKAVRQIGEPVFVKGRAGTQSLVRFLREGGVLAMLIDQHAAEGADLEFMGKPARTILSAARLAIRYDALVVPYYGVRKENGLDFRAIFEAPIEHGDPAVMTQLLNDSLERQVRAHPGQWFWIHQRWRDRN